MTKYRIVKKTWLDNQYRIEQKMWLKWYRLPEWVELPFYYEEIQHAQERLGFILKVTNPYLNVMCGEVEIIGVYES